MTSSMLVQSDICGDEDDVYLAILWCLTEFQLEQMETDIDENKNQ